MLFMMALSVSSNFNCFWRGSIFNVFFQRRGPGIIIIIIIIIIMGCNHVQRDSFLVYRLFGSFR